jgi:hypothetical protein
MKLNSARDQLDAQFNRSKRPQKPEIEAYDLLASNFLVYKDIEYKNISWYGIITRYKLSEEFMRAFKDQIDWFWVPKYQTVTEEFLLEFIDNVDPYMVLTYQNKSPQIKALLQLKNL